MNQLVLVFCSCYVIYVLAYPQSASGVVEYQQEERCSRAGGMCVQKEYCNYPSKSGSCPSQQQYGAVCCHGLPTNEYRCRKLGGYCRSNCNQPLYIQQAKDCPSETVCCALVH